MLVGVRRVCQCILVLFSDGLKESREDKLLQGIQWYFMIFFVWKVEYLKYFGILSFVFIRDFFKYIDIGILFFKSIDENNIKYS